MSFGSLTFLAPLGLLGLILLPLIWWLLRTTPPRPKDQIFPPLRILADIAQEEETPDKTPWWLLLFRMGLVALIAIALARPVLQRIEGSDARDIVIVVDNGYAAGGNWTQIMREAQDRIAQARRANLNVALMATRGNGAVSFTPANAALTALEQISPDPLTPDHASAATRLSALDISGADAIWLSDGVNYGDGNSLGQTLSKAVKSEILIPSVESSPLFAGEISEAENGFRITYHRAGTGGLRAGTIIAYGADGRVIGRAPLTFVPGQASAEASFDLPADLRNRVSLIRPEGLSSAGAVKLLDDSWGRPVVGVLASVNDDNTQPLLSDIYYVEKALGPNADIFKGNLSDLLALAPSIIVMSDNARIEDEALTDFVEAGGMLIRFAGPKLAARSDTLLPVDLRFGDRALGGALTWEDPQGLAAFGEDSPFFALPIPDDVNVTQQVMAQPGAQTDLSTWARLTDGSPVVTSSLRGQGRVVLFHVTSGPEWSNLAISGLYVSMLKRLLPLARAAPSKAVASGGAWSPERTLDAFGRLTAPPLSAQPIEDGTFDTVRPDAEHLPGLYRQGARRTALNTVPEPESLQSITGVSGMKQIDYSVRSARSLMGTLLTIGLALLALDALIALLLTGRLSRLMPKRRALASLAVMAILIPAVFTPTDVSAQNSVEADALGLHFAYVITGNGRMDRKSEDGLKGVTRELTRRTTVEPAPPRGVNIETDDLVIYPFIYWPVSRDAQAPSDKAVTAINRYLESGGTIVFDTQDEGDAALRVAGQHPGLARISENLDIPTLKAVPDDHVLGKSFFLLDNFPGRWADGQVWVDAESIGARDGVASVIIGSNDWASAWAVTDDGEYYGELEETMPRQREFAKRFGVNLAMYVLAGNYKADQVHVPELLKRLGSDGTTDLEDIRERIRNTPETPNIPLPGGD